MTLFFLIHFLNFYTYYILTFKYYLSAIFVTNFENETNT